MKRRTFVRNSMAISAAAAFSPVSIMARKASQTGEIRLGGPVFGKYSSPEEWISMLKANSYRAAQCPVKPGVGAEEIAAYKKAAMQNDILIAEVGAWSNPISNDAAESEAAIEKCISSLELADEIGARCCVNVSGSKNEEYWAGPHKDNLRSETFDQVVEITRKIIDAVNPGNTCFALEAMPWSYPDSTESYLRLIKAIDRKAFGVHLDPVNMIRSPWEFYNNGALIKEMFAKLGPMIKSCHAKDIILREDNYIPQMDEIRPGMGKLDYGIYLTELSILSEIPLMMEHLNTNEEYMAAAKYIREVGSRNGINI